ncbi:MAG: InlB B-repeat-containing protein [Lachnospiraceae bacterium]|nr:InlB B-repeat-containing protein [Lachnospiraceae bacterium]
MKKRLKTYLAILFSFVLMINTISISAEMSENDINQDLPTVESEQNTEEVQNTDVEDSQDSDMFDTSTLYEDIEVTSAEEPTTIEITTEEAASDETEEATTETSEEESVNMPEFSGFKIVDGVIVLVTAPEGVFPEGSTLSVAKVNEEEQKDIDDAVDKTRDENLNVAASYTYDIKVLDADGNEIQPVDGQKVNVSFALEEAGNENLTADVYHITEENGELAAEVLETSEQGSLVTAESDGFSYYTVEFTYGDLQYVMQGDSEVALIDILSFVGITKADGSVATDSDIITVSVSDESLFSATNESGEWMVTAYQAFSTDEWMKVTVDGVEYEIVVTDAASVTLGGFNVPTNYLTAGKMTVLYYTSEGTYLNRKSFDVQYYGDQAQGGIRYTVDYDTVNINDSSMVSTNDYTLSERYSNGYYNLNKNTLSSETNCQAGYNQNNGFSPITGTFTIISAYIYYNIPTGANISNYYFITIVTCTSKSVDPTYTAPTLASGLTYNGSAQQLISSAGSTSGNNMQYGISSSNTTAPTSWYSSINDSNMKKTDVGTYYVWYKADAVTGYNAVAATCVGSVSIAKASNPITYANQSWSYTYATSAQTKTLNAATNAQGTVTYSLQSQKSGSTDVTYFSLNTSTRVLTAKANTPVGTYTVVVRASAAESSNYKSGYKDSKVTITIGKANATATAPKAANKTYNGSSQTIANAGSATGGTIYYGLGASKTSSPSTWDTSLPSKTNVGTYYIWYKVTGDCNHNDIAATYAATATISNATITVNAPNQSYTYDGSAHGSVIAVTTVGSQTATIKYGTVSGTYNLNSNPTAINVNDSKTVYYQVTAPNHSTVTGSFTLTITKADSAVTAPTAKTELIYDKSAQELINAGNSSTGTIKYAVTEEGASAPSDSAYSTDIPSKTNAGTYKVWYKSFGDDNHSDSAASSIEVTIGKKELELTWGDTSFTYNGSSQAPTAIINGVINGDDCTVSVSGAQTNYSAEAYTATAELNGAQKGNYVLPADKTTTFKIGKKTATITANNQIVTYGTPIASDVASVTAAGLVDGDILTAITLTPSTSDVTSNGTIRPSGATIKKGTTDVTDNYNITYNNGALTINKKPITISGITAEDKTYDGTTAATLNYNGINWSACGMVAGDDLSVTASGTFSDANVGTGKIVTITDLALGGTKAGNYELASSVQQTSTTANINAKAITITADSDSKVYDGTAHTKNNYSITNGELATGDSIESVTVTGSQTFVGSSDNEPSAAVIKNSSGVNVTGNYDITYTNGTLTVTKKPLTITADSDTKVYDSTPLTKDSYTHTELASGDNITSVTITGSQTSVGESTNEPSAAVIKKGDEDVTANYDITYANGTLTVTKKVVTITANSDTKIYDGTVLTNDGYTVSGLETGDRVDSVTITGSQTSVGTNPNVPSVAVIKNSAEEVVNDNYTISYVNGTLEVTKKAITITADSDTKVYDGTELTKDSYSITDGELASGDSIVSVTVTGTQTFAGESANVPSAAVIKNANGDNVTASYDITYKNGTLEVTQKAVTITADDATKVYDGTPLIKDSYTNSNLVAGDTITGVIVTGSQTSAGQSANVPSEAVIKNAADEDVTASYDITYVDGTLEVTKKPITISGINVIDKIFDGTDNAPLDYSDIDWISCGMVDGDELSVTATGTFEDTSVGTNKNVAITDITLGGTSVDNYILSEDGQQTTATATINKKEVTVTALKQTVAINGEIENSVEFAELSGALEGHELAEITLTSGSTAKTTTEGVITPSEAKIVNGDTDVTDNYDISYIDGVMTVTKAEAEVVLDNGDDEALASITEVEVPNLLELADEEAEEGRLVKVELSVKPVSENKVSKATVSDVKKTVESLFAFVDMESVKVEYLEIDLTKYVDNVKESAISDTGKPLEIILTYDTSKAGNPVIIRNHEGTVVVFTQLSARPTGSFTDATYYVEGDKIYMYSQYFSDFAIAYSVEKTFNVILDDGNGNIIRQIVSEGTKFIPPTDLTKDGYDFGGWYKDEAFTEKWNPDTNKITSDIKLFAKWTKKTEPAKVDVPETKVDTPEANVETSKVDVPKAPATGDKINIGIIVMLMMDSAMAALYLTLRRRMLK